MLEPNKTARLTLLLAIVEVGIVRNSGALIKHGLELYVYILS